MAQEQSYTLVVRDGAGTYYIFPPERLAQAQATPEEQAWIEQLLAGNDTSGFTLLGPLGQIGRPLVAGPPAAETTSGRPSSAIQDGTSNIIAILIG